MDKLKKICLWIFIIYIANAILFWFIVGDGFHQKSETTNMVTEAAITGELLAGRTVSQTFISKCDTVDCVTILGSTYGRINKDTLTFSLVDEKGCILTEAELKTEELPDASRWLVQFDKLVTNCRGQVLTLNISSVSGIPGNAVTFFYGNSISAGKVEVTVASDYQVQANGKALDGTLCMAVTGTSYYKMADYYWYFVTALGIVVVLLCFRLIHNEKAGNNSVGLRLINAFSKYSFLLRQLVLRDFKTKYKRSALGMLWSFINPLLTMLVMYIIFASLFKSTIVNFPVYLLIGIVCWNFFSESTSMCLTSITGNASLITKVYMPKYMYPFSRTVSSLVNLGFSLVPLFIVLAFTKTHFTVQYLLLPFPLICLFLFSMGMGLFLAASMVFFRDTQFLWGVISLLWMYLTPIFYDTDIIPDKFMTFYKMNPLYHIVRIFRIILINGVSPEPKAYLLCVAASVIPFILGVWVFKKTQDRFVLYL